MYFITRNERGITVRDEHKTSMYKQGIKQFLNQLCMEHHSTFEGRIEAARYTLNKRNNIPLYINDETILFQTMSIRSYDMFYINSVHTLFIKERDMGTCIIVFDDFSETIVKGNYHDIKNRFELAKRFSSIL